MDSHESQRELYNCIRLNDAQAEQRAKATSNKVSYIAFCSERAADAVAMLHELDTLMSDGERAKSKR
jgi:hypothetical protein